MSKKLLEYTTRENMFNLRAAFNRGEDLTKITPEFVCKSGMLEDLEYLKYIFENGYSGYTYFSKNLFDKAFDNINNFIQNTQVITVEKFIDMLSDEFRFITDGHLTITNSKNSAGFYNAYYTYVADIKINEIDGRYFIDESDKEIILTEGSILFKTIPNTGQTQYFIGTRSYEVVDEITVIVDGDYTHLPVHRINSSLDKSSDSCSVKIYNHIAYVRSGSFIGDNEADLQSAFETGKQCSEFKNVVWDLSGNLGGNSDFAKKFIEGLNTVCNAYDIVYQLESSLINAKETGTIKEIPYHLKPISRSEENLKGSFKGNLYIIINDRVASSGENAIVFSKNIKNRIVFGCNSLGIGNFGDLLIYYLPNSNITVWLPSKIFDNNIEETVGYTPDFWLDTKDTVKAVLDFIN